MPIDVIFKIQCLPYHPFGLSLSKSCPYYYGRKRRTALLQAQGERGLKMNEIRNIVILTGAGVSAESGIGTFRDKGGLWEQHRVEDVATPEGFARDPDLVLRFYDMRREAILKAQPNAAHWALAHLDAEWPGELLIVTQNVDDLHERAGGKRLIHMHGEHLKALCTTCEVRSNWKTTLADRPDCPVCSVPTLRPDVVWFGEIPYRMDEIEEALSRCDMFVSIGTSGAVYPAAGYVRTARHYGAQTLELNLEPSQGSIYFDRSRMGKAGDLVPEWVAEILV
jgi:NAD-dependent deacetylase